MRPHLGYYIDKTQRLQVDYRVARNSQKYRLHLVWNISRQNGKYVTVLADKMHTIKATLNVAQLS